MKTTNHAQSPLFLALLVIAFGSAFFILAARLFLIGLSLTAYFWMDYLSALPEVVETEVPSYDLYQAEHVTVKVETPLQTALQLVANGLSQRAAARQTGVPQTAISRSINKLC